MFLGVSADSLESVEERRERESSCIWEHLKSVDTYIVDKMCVTRESSCSYFRSSVYSIRKVLSTYLESIINESDGTLLQTVLSRHKEISLSLNGMI